MKNFNRPMVLSILLFSFSVLGIGQSSWVGDYVFDEDGGETVGGTKIYVVHNLSIEKDETGDLKAHLYSQGFQTSVDIYTRAKAVGDKLKLYFEKKGDNHVLGDYENGALLLSLEKTNRNGRDQILTYWGKFFPTVPANEETGQVYFKRKDDERTEPNIVLLGGKVRTVDAKNTTAEAIALNRNRIVAIGKNSEIRKLIGANTKVIDAKGKLVLPGFNDSHVHFTGIGNLFTSLDLRFVRNPKQVAEKLRRYVRFVPKGRWILGGQWDHSNWPAEKLPTKEDIDSVTPDNPVFFYSKDAKMAWANSAALRIANVDKNRADLAGGTIVRDEAGEPTGILKGGAIRLVKMWAPRLATTHWYEVTQAATNYAASLGVTSVQDVHSDDQLEVLTRLQNEGKLKTRVYDCIALAKWKKLAKELKGRLNSGSLVRRGCLKAMADNNPESEKVMYADIRAADKAGLQVMIHAIGRTQNESILQIFEQVIESNGPKDRRFRVEHAYRFKSEDLLRFGASGIIPSLQPKLFYGSDPYRSLIESNAKIAFGSDASITDFNPLEGIAAAVNLSDNGEALTVEEAVRFYTMGSAYAEFQEQVKGSIEVGKLADLVILSDDIFSIDAADIRGTKVLMTIVDGNVVYKAKTFE